jgi:hypothetical protein
MIVKRPSRIRRGMSMIGSAFPSIWELVRALVRRDPQHTGTGRTWMAPLMVFLCVTGLLLVVAASVEALAPFIYSIF